MKKIMLVIENAMEQTFLEKFTRRLGFQTLAISKNQVVADQLRDFFPDLVFASMIGKQSRTLKSLSQIKASRGIPKVVFVRQENDNSPLTPEQKQIVDGLLYSPIDPFKLIDILSDTMEISSDELRSKYKSLSSSEGSSGSGSSGSAQKKQGKVLLFDSERKSKYDKIVADITEANKDHAEFDGKRFKELQNLQAANAKDDPQLTVLKKNFIRTLFSAPPKNKA